MMKLSNLTETIQEHSKSVGTLVVFFTFQPSAVAATFFVLPNFAGLWERLRWTMPENETEACWRPYVLT